MENAFAMIEIVKHVLHHYMVLVLNVIKVMLFQLIIHADV